MHTNSTYTTPILRVSFYFVVFYPLYIALFVGWPSIFFFATRLNQQILTGKTRCQYWRTEYFNVNLFSTASTGQCISITDKLLILLLPSNKAKLISRLVLRQNKGKAYWPIFQLAALVSFRASAVTALNFTAVMLLSLHYSDGPEDD